jgi:hypothetical protein
MILAALDNILCMSGSLYVYLWKWFLLAGIKTQAEYGRGVVNTQFKRFYGYIIFEFADDFAFFQDVFNFGKGKPRLIATQPAAAGTVP